MLKSDEWHLLSCLASSFAANIFIDILTECCEKLLLLKEMEALFDGCVAESFSMSTVRSLFARYKVGIGGAVAKYAY